jgi:hypothetical protein
MESSKQEMELVLPFPVIESKNFFNISIPIWSKDSKMFFRTRKWNYVNRKWNYLNRKWNHLKQEMELVLPFPVLRSKSFFNKRIPIWSNDSKWFSGTGNGIT